MAFICKVPYELFGGVSMRAFDCRIYLHYGSVAGYNYELCGKCLWRGDNEKKPKTAQTLRPEGKK